MARRPKAPPPLNAAIPKSHALDSGPRYNQEEDGGVIGYMCLVDWEHELGTALGGNILYPSVEDLREHRPCVKECGIAKVKVFLEEVVQEQDFSAYEKES